LKLDFASNYLVCLRCPRRQRVAERAGLVICSLDGRSIIDHALEDYCAEPGAGADRFAAAGKTAMRLVPAAAGCGCGDGGIEVQRGLRRIELLKPICESCEHFVSITIRQRPLTAAVACKATPGCCGGDGPGSLDLIYGNCVELKHEAALKLWQAEGVGCGGESCH
jgi:hypothetical protein